MNDAMNPLLPAAYDLVWSAVVLITLVPLVIALVSIGRNRNTLTSNQTLVWVLLVIFLPVIGSVAWLVAGRPARTVETTMSKQSV